MTNFELNLKLICTHLFKYLRKLGIKFSIQILLKTKKIT